LRQSLRGASSTIERIHAKNETYIAVIGKAMNTIPTAKNAIVTTKEQTNVMMHGDLPFLVARTIFEVGGGMLSDYQKVALMVVLRRRQVLLEEGADAAIEGGVLGG